MLSYQLFAENVLFLPLHWRNEGAIWSWLKLLTDNKNIFTSSPPIVPSCGFSQSLFPPLIAKTIKTKQHKFVSSTLKIFKSQHIKRHLWLEVCKWVSGETFYLLTRGSCCKTRTFISTLFAKVAFKKPPSCAFYILWLFHQWCQDMLHFILLFTLTLYRIDIISVVETNWWRYQLNTHWCIVGSKHAPGITNKFQVFPVKIELFL